MHTVEVHIPKAPWKVRLIFLKGALTGTLKVSWEVQDKDIPSLYARLGNHLRWNTPKKKEPNGLESVQKQLQFSAQQMGKDFGELRDARSSERVDS